MTAPSAQRNDVPPGAAPVEFLRLMLRTRLFEEFCMRLKKEGAVLGNTYPCLGQEALGVAALALAPGDAVFPSYRSRAIVFGKGATAEQHFRELIGAPESEQGGREVFHHAAFPGLGIMPSSSMIGGWAPTAAGYALTQHLERSGTVTVCVIGDGVLGAGDLHEALNIAGVWKLPFVLMVENNGYQVSAGWNQVRAQRAIAPYVQPYGFVTRPVDGNNPFDVFHSTAWARAEALAGRPAMLDCETYRMGGYSSHFGEPRTGIEEELAAWRRRDPVAFMEDWLLRQGGSSKQALAALRAEEAEAIASAWQSARREADRR
ncbi:MAG TPA: thiamine pyrophosphate-dependent dehydrogenase E1 component subunit alpha [Alphaproteobacteria bacterium]|jgi:TPP-dependent pyruvate/acetoin dehydrogenase alpha subunit